MSLRDKLKNIVSNNFVEIIRPLSATPAFMGEDEDDIESNDDRGFNWSAAPVTSMEPAAIIAQEQKKEIESTREFATIELVQAQYPTAESAKVQFPPARPAEVQFSSRTGRDFKLSVSLRDVVASNGVVDFDGLFASASLPDASITAEQGAWILNMLPTDLPARVRRISARSSLEAISKFDVQAAANSVGHIVNDAALKMLYVSQLSKELSTQAGTQRARVESDIALLEAEIQARRAALAETELTLGIAQESCRTRMGKFNDVIEFFDHADFSQDGEVLSMVEVETSETMETPLRMVGGAFK